MRMEGLRLTATLLVITVIIGVTHCQEQFLAKSLFNSEGHCPDGFTDLADSDYIDYNGTTTPFTKNPYKMCLHHIMMLMTWEDALRYCRVHKTDLVTALNREEMRAIHQFMESVNGTAQRKLAAFYYNWMGATDRFKDGDWKWIVGDELIPLADHDQFWNVGEPMSYDVCLTTIAGEYQLHNFNRDDNYRGWETNDCLRERPFLCQTRY